jgi:hypothetical protein
VSEVEPEAGTKGSKGQKRRDIKETETKKEKGIGMEVKEEV